MDWMNPPVDRITNATKSIGASCRRGADDVVNDAA